ncbi:MAG: sigma-54 dependent transcriptional regulator [Gammaproteobacteria bacterium]
MTASPLILLIDDDKNRMQGFKSVLEFIEYRVESAGSSEFVSLLDQTADAIAVFVGAGIEKQASLVKTVAESAGDTPVALLIGKGELNKVPTAVQKMVGRIQEWPAVYPELSESLKQFRSLRDNRQAERRTAATTRGLSGNGPGISRTRKLISQVAGSEATVLILGESGTGKEVIARSLHRASARSDKPFVPVNCGAIPGELLESELFGHEKGAFTGALTSRQGRFELAEGGTLFLDEIGDMPMSMQVKLLRVLQERTFERVGSNRTIHCDVRIIAATHRDLENEIEENRFREDLFYRLNVFPIEVPALRERAEDIPLLAVDLIARIEAEGRESIRLTNGAMQLLMRYSWPGNVRELENLLERLAIMNPDGIVDVKDLPEKYRGNDVEGEKIDCGIGTREEKNGGPSFSSIRALNASPFPEQGIDLREYLNAMEINLIQQALDECGGVVAHAANRLKMRRTTLVEKLRKYNLPR